MTKKGHIKRLFPGGNTSIGFYSYFQYIIDPKEARKIYYIKGGPGVGKSYMMKKLGYGFVERGLNVEFHHCAAEPESLDAIVIPEIKVAIMDGTSPHVEDPKYPGATGTIINLGEFLDEESLRKNKDKIIGATEDNKNIYIRVYKYLAAAKLIHDDIEWINGHAMNFSGVNKETDQLLKEYLEGIEGKDRIGKERHLFGSSYTLKGKIDHGETFIGLMDQILYIKGAAGTGKSTLLEKLSSKALMKGYDVEIYHEPLVPEKIETILIPELSLGFTTNSKFKGEKTVDLDRYKDQDKIKKYKEELDHSQQLLSNLLNEVFNNLKKTNGVHDEIEKYYTPHISYEDLNKTREKLSAEIIEMLKEG